MRRMRVHLIRKKAGHQQKRWWELAVEGLEPTSKNTGKTQLPTQRGSDLAQSEWILEFTVRLTEAGFSDVQVARILEAAERAAVELST